MPFKNFTKKFDIFKSKRSNTDETLVEKIIQTDVIKKTIGTQTDFEGWDYLDSVEFTGEVLEVCEKKGYSA